MSCPRPTPDCGQRVEILVGETWVPAVFVCADYSWDPESGDEWWWSNHYQLDDGCTVPEDVCYYRGPLPQWRPLADNFPISEDGWTIRG